MKAGESYKRIKKHTEIVIVKRILNDDIHLLQIVCLQVNINYQIHLDPVTLSECALENQISTRFFMSF